MSRRIVTNITPEPVKELWVITYTETVDGERKDAHVFSAVDEEDALRQAVAIYEDWSWIEPDIRTTRIGSNIDLLRPVWIEFGGK